MLNVTVPKYCVLLERAGTHFDVLQERARFFVDGRQ